MQRGYKPRRALFAEAGRDLQSRPGRFVQGSSLLPGTKHCGRDNISRPAKKLKYTQNVSSGVTNPAALWMALLAQNPEAGRDLQSRPGRFVQGSSLLPGTKHGGRDNISRPAKKLKYTQNVSSGVTNPAAL